MEITGRYEIPVPRDAVWVALNDPDVLKACIPGCESLEKRSPTEFEATVVAKVGPVKARFTGSVTLSDLKPPSGYRISGGGSGGIAGFAKGGALVHMVEEGSTTVLTYEAEAQIGGKLAQLGSRLIVGVARRMADEFFGAFVAEVSKSQGGEGGELAVSPVAITDDTQGKPGGGWRRWLSRGA